MEGMPFIAMQGDDVEEEPYLCYACLLPVVYKGNQPVVCDGCCSPSQMACYSAHLPCRHLAEDMDVDEVFQQLSSMCGPGERVR